MAEVRRGWVWAGWPCAFKTDLAGASTGQAVAAHGKEDARLTVERDEHDTEDGNDGAYRDERACPRAAHGVVGNRGEHGLGALALLV
jgi:hypothetical protein